MKPHAHSRKVRSRSLVATLLLLALLAPATNAQETHPAPPTDTTLWLHVDGIQDFAMSPQTVPDSHRATYGLNALTHSNRCLVGPPAPPLLYGNHHTWYGVPGPVAYRPGPDLIDRGLAFNLELDLEKQPTLVWHLAGRTSTTIDGVPPPSDAMVLPNVVLRATLREDSAVSVGHHSLDTGTLLAQAQTRPATLSPLLAGHPNVSYHETDDAPVYTFRLPLEWRTNQPTIQASTAFNLRVDVYIDFPTCDRPDEATLMPDLLGLYTAPAFRPSLTLGVQNPLWIQELRPTPTANGTVQIHAIAASPWGAHDLAAPTLTTDDEPAGTPTTHRALRPLPPPTWTWNLTPDKAPHTVHLEAKNLHGDTATGTAHFELGTGRVVSCQGPGPDACTERIHATGPKKDSPAAPTGTILLGLLAAGLVLARRRP